MSIASHGGVRLKDHLCILFLKVWLRCFFFSQLNNMAEAKVILFELSHYGGSDKVRILNELNTMSYPRAIESHNPFQSSYTVIMLVVLLCIGK